MLTTIIDNLRKIDGIYTETEKLLADYIKEKYNGRIEFNDNTTYPTFHDYSDDEAQSVVAVKVDEDGDILFNTDMKKVSDGVWAVDEDYWFRPRDYGEFDLNNLVDVISGMEN